MKMMNAQTMTGCAALIRADDGLEPREKTRLIAQLKSRPKPEGHDRSGPLVAPRRVAASMLGRSLRFVDALARSGVLRRVKMPGRARACGIRADDLNRLIEASTVAGVVDGKAAS